MTSALYKVPWASHADCNDCINLNAAAWRLL